jgi:hypothetical protein
MIVVATLRRVLACCGLGLGLGLAGSMAMAAAEQSDTWPGFRGHGDSIAGPGAYAVTWSGTNQLAWRVRVDGIGQGSPVIWDGLVYSASVAGERKERLVVQAHALVSGREAWRFSTNSALPEPLSDTRSRSAPTPVAGAEGVFVFFESGDCLALTHEGGLRWHRVVTEEAGELAGNHGLGGSPVLASEVLLVPLDQERPSKLMALDRKTGATRWMAARPGRTGWSTPIVVRSGAVEQVVISCGGSLTGYDVRDGAGLWEVGGLVRNLVPSPSWNGDLLMVGAGGKGSNRAFRWDGGTNAPQTLWEASDVTVGFASPLIHAGRVYFLATAGVLSAFEASTGRALFDARLPDSAWASPVGAGDHVYVFGQRGTTTVLKASDTYQPVATNTVAFDSKVVGVAANQGWWVIRAEKELLGIAPVGTSGVR